MWQYFIGAWVLISLFDNPYEKRRRKYNQLVVEHLTQMNENIENFKRLLREDNNPFAIQAIADAMGCNLHIYSLEDIDYILIGIYEELPEKASEIARLINEMPGTPQPRGYGLEFV